MTSIVGLDIGGANLKVASSLGQCETVAFPLWLQKNGLKARLAEILSKHPCHRVLATMTGELADCFVSRQEGVSFIVDALVAACQDANAPSPLFYQLPGVLVEAETAVRSWQRTAAANWNAIASWTAQSVGGRGVLIDLGSTTCDIIPFENGIVLDPVSDDLGRMKDNRLVYVGSQRTPVTSLLTMLDCRGTEIGLAREFFATIDDALIVVGLSEEDHADLGTADGRPRTRDAASRRLAKMLCLDVGEQPDLVEVLASATIERARDLISTGVKKVLQGRGWVESDLELSLVVAGSGESLLASWLTDSGMRVTHRWSSMWGEVASSAAAAYSIVQLAERIDRYKGATR